MQELIEEFSDYLRLSYNFHNADPVIPLEQELSLVRSYLFIEKQRFEDRLRVEWEIDPELNFLLPPFSIQPIVENAIKHGMMLSGITIRLRIEK